MYIEIQTKGKTKQIFLRKSVRDKESGKIKKITIANLTHEPIEQVASIVNALENKSQINPDNLQQGRSMGLSFVIYFLMHFLNIVKAVGKSFEAKIALMLIAARIVIQSSRLQALYWSKRVDHILDIVGFTQEEKERLNDKTIYKGLDYLYEHQERMENSLYKYNYTNKRSKPKRLYYDVTSSYVEGEYEDSSLVAYGYNRDGKKGKKQIVIGLLTDECGKALSVDVYPGNTNDVKTFDKQLQKAKERFKIEHITIVGDGGMIKSNDIETIKSMGYDYITSIGKDTIKKMCNDHTSKMDCTLFDEDLKEFIEEDTRYILRVNPAKQAEIRVNREGKLKALEEFVKEKQEYYNTHYRAKKETLQKSIDRYIEKLQLDKFVTVLFEYENKEMEVLDKRSDTSSLKTKEIAKEIRIVIDQKSKQEIEQLDGCYVIKTSITDSQTKEEIHKAYKELIKVENAFKTLKTEFLEIRPLYLKTDKRIKGHIFLSMLAYNVTHQLKSFMKEADVDFRSTIKELRSIVSVTVKIKEKITLTYIPTITSATLLKLFDVMQLKMPKRVDYSV